MERPGLYVQMNPKFVKKQTNTPRHTVEIANLLLLCKLNYISSHFGVTGGSSSSNPILNKYGLQPKWTEW